ncbi:unnamed protein product, partial [Polarella glacialis]
VQLEAHRTPLARRLMGSWAPRFLLPRSFEARLRETLAGLRCEFVVEIDRSGPSREQPFGLGLKEGTTQPRGLEVTEVATGGLVESYNMNLQLLSSRLPRVQPGDRLVAVNTVTTPSLMVERLKNSTDTRTELRFSRRAADSGPGVWEIDLQRLPDEGWGMELREQETTTPSGPRSAGVLRVHSVAHGMAVDRWNRMQDPGHRWRVQPGDVLVACEPEVSPARVLGRLKTTQHARLTLLRWHQGPAPESPGVTHAGSSTSWEVTLRRSQPDDRLGLRLNPSTRDPTRTAVAEVVAGGLVDRHNQALGGSKNPPAICVDDEVDAVNGDGDPSRFAEGCQKPHVVLRLTRRSGPFSMVAGPATASASAPATVTHTPAPAPAVVSPVDDGWDFDDSGIPQDVPAHQAIDPPEVNTAAVQEELCSLRAARESLQEENTRLRAEAQRAERGSAAAQRAAEQEAAALRSELAELRLQQERLQEQRRTAEAQTSEAQQRHFLCLREHAERAEANIAAPVASGAGLQLQALDSCFGSLLQIQVSSKMLSLKLRVTGGKMPIANTYAPHSGKPLDERQCFWDDFNSYLQSLSGNGPTLDFGDFNARFHRRFPRELAITAIDYKTCDAAQTTQTMHFNLTFETHARLQLTMRKMPSQDYWG